MKSLLVVALSLVTLMSCGSNHVGTTVTEEGDTLISKVVGGNEFKALIAVGGVQLIDVRTPGEYAAGKIGEAVNIDFFGDDFEKNILSLDKNLPTLVYCKSGNRSGKAAAKMKELGFREVYDLRGGYSGWAE